MISDHTAQKLVFVWKEVIFSEGYRSFSSGNMEIFSTKLNEICWSSIYDVDSSNVSQQWENFQTLFFEVFNSSFSIHERKVGKKKKNSYFILDDDVESKRKLDILYILCNTDHSYNSNYNRTKREYNHKLNLNRKRFYQTEIMLSDNKSKIIWRIVRNVQGKDI